ncbi:lipase [Chitinophagaceae bacterium IBVUCB2]|nr:lipase [Chitinophagaceae bacterium IBVUCB2]
MKKLLLAGLVFQLAVSSFAQEATDTTYKPVELPAGFSSQMNVVYTKAKDWEGQMDIYMPAKDKGPSPVVINIHGGGWNKGVRQSQTGFNTFFKMGYAVANISYRLTGHTTAPAAVEDTRCALIYLIKNAKALNIDVNKIVIMGGSAGGHLALMGGLLGNDHRFDGNCPGVENVKVAAIIDKYGITDVWDWGYGTNVTSKSATRWLGDKANDKKFAASVSPITYVSKNSPPIFIVHGDADPTVPYQQSVDLHKKLVEVGVKTEFITVEGGLHGKFDKDKNSEINKKIAAFLTSLGLVGAK